MDLSKLSDADLMALKAGDLTKVSDAGLMVLKGEPAPQERSSMDELGRQIGLAARAGVKSLLTVPAMLSDAATGVVNTGLDVVRGKGNGFRFQTVNSAADNLMTGAGIAAPENATERVVQDATQAMGGTGATVKAGQFLAKNAAPVVSKIGQFLSAGPGMQTAAALTSSGAQGITRENGGDAVDQFAAGMGGAFLPAAAVGGGSAVVRGLLRGGEEGRQTVAKNIKLFDDAAGVSPSVGQATEGRVGRGIESFLSKAPGGAGVMQKSAQDKAAAMAKAVNDTADSLAPGASGIKAGEAIEKGVQGFKEGFKKVQERLYNTLDKHIPNDSPIQVGNTEFALKQLNEGIEGAPNISEFFKNSKIKGIDVALQKDLELSATGGTLPYEAVKKLRTLIGREIADNSLLADVPRSKWTALYGALSEDLGMAAKQAGPQAEQSWQWANQFTKGQLDRLESLSKIVGKDSPEKIFQAALAGTSEGNTIIKRVVDAIPKDNRKELAAAVLRRMGQANNSAQNAAGDVFSSETFLTNINKLSPEARSTLFGRLGVPDVPNKLAQLAEMAANMREGSKVFANPSGTAQALSLRDAGLGTLGALLTGHPGVAAASAGVVGGSNLLAKKMTDPDFVKWLANRTEVSPTLPAVAGNALQRALAP